MVWAAQPSTAQHSEALLEEQEQEQEVRESGTGGAGRRQKSVRKVCPDCQERQEGLREEGGEGADEVGQGCAGGELLGDVAGGLWVGEFGQDTQCSGPPESPTVPSGSSW